MKRLLAVLLFAGACAQAYAQATARIELLPDVEVEGDRVRLGEVAHLHANALATIRQLAELPLGPAPRAGEAAVLHRDMLARWLRSRMRLDPVRLEWSGAGEARLVRASQHVAGERVSEAALTAARAWLRERGTTAEVEVRQPPRDLDVPKGSLRLDARPPASTLPRARMHVWVDVFVDGGLVRSVPVLLDVPGLGSGESPARELAPLRAAESRRAALAPVAVSRGDWASLHTAAGAVTLESRVEVLQDGRVGDKVRVRTRGATGLVLARVLAPGQLELAP